MSLIAPDSILVGLPIFLFWAYIFSRTSFFKQNVDANTLKIITGAILFSLLYMSQTSSLMKENDIYGHWHYINTLYMGIFPSTSYGWQTYQPPTYYILAQLFYFPAHWAEISRPMEAVRALALCCYFVFLCYSSAVIKFYCKDKKLHALAMIMLVCWPVGTLMSGKINNDVLVYPLVMASTFHLLKWQKNKAIADLRYAMIFALAAYATKSTGLLMVGVAIFVCCYEVYCKRAKWKTLLNKKFITVIAIAAVLAFGLNQGRTIYNYAVKNHKQNLLIANMYPTTALRWRSLLVNDTWQNYVKFDSTTFINSPYVQNDYDEGGRRSFWNTIFKTSILAMDKWGNPYIAHIISALFMTLLGYFIYSYAGILQAYKGNRRYYLAPLLLFVSGSFGLLYLRAIFPVTGFGDIRYIYYYIPFLICSIVYAIKWNQTKKNIIAAKFGYYLCVLLILSFVLFMFDQYVISLDRIKNFFA